MTDEQYAARKAEIERWDDASDEAKRLELAELEREHDEDADDDADGW